MNNYPVRIIVGLTVVLVILFYGFSFVLQEGEKAVITRFGAPRTVVSSAGIHTKLPWPFEQVHVLDGRKQYFDSGFLESLTKDKKNVILQTYIIWSVNDPLFFVQTTGSSENAQIFLDTMVNSAKNAILGNYDLSALVSTDENEIKLGEIEAALNDEVKATASERFGVEVHQVGLKKLGLPDANIGQVFSQMRAERNQYVAQLEAEGQRDASIIRNEADVRVAELRAEGREQAAEITRESEAEVAAIYGRAFSANPEFYSFLRKLESLERILGENSTLIFRTNEAPFDALISPE